MSLLDDLCRLCAQKLDLSMSRNIFEPEQKDLLSIILRCIPVTVEKHDRYPKYVCIHCVFKLEVLFEMSDQSLLSVKIFNDILATERKNDPNQLLEVKQEELYQFEMYEEPEHKFDSSGNEFECEHCSNLFSSKEQLIKHIAAHLTTGRVDRKPLRSCYACETCGSSFSLKSDLRRHVIKHTGNISKRTPFGKSVLNGDNKETHTKKKSYFCKICSHGFSRRYYLNRHVLMHTGNKPHKCEVCEKSFGTKSSLIRHRGIHLREKRYQCMVCAKGFSDRTGFIRHQLVHTGRRGYSCKLCEKSFNDPSTLIVHNRTHTGEKPYTCSDCGKGFSKVSTRNRHEAIHTGNRPHHCHLCGRNFQRLSTLLVHIRMHTDRKFSEVASQNAHQRASGDSCIKTEPVSESFR